MKPDLNVERVSSALDGRSIDLIITGSIASVESVRFIRALRRIGAKVSVWASPGALQFITPTALSWAAAEQIRTDFSGHQSHVAEADGCVVAPASANFLYKLANGKMDSATSALATSYAGAGKPLMILPCMHESLAAAPAVSANLNRILSFPNCHLMRSRTEETKQKFPAPEQLADDVAHIVNQREPKQKAVVAFGGTQAAVDQVRYLSNYSTGALGSLLSAELYRQGVDTIAIAGTVTHLPHSYNRLLRATTHAAMQSLTQQSLDDAGEKAALVFMPAILDYEPKHIASHKIASGREDLTIELQPTKKILATLRTHAHSPRIACKLICESDLKKADEIARSYIDKYKLTMLVVNSIESVREGAHQALVYSSHNPTQAQKVAGKEQIVQEITKHIKGV